MQNKPNIMLHIIMPKQVSGPNTSNRNIASSYLSEKYEFRFLTQSFKAKGKINVKLIRDMRRQVKSFNPDIIHISGLQASGFHAVVAARLAGCRNIIITVHGFSGDAIGLKPIKRLLFTKIFEPLTLKMADKVFTVCEEASNKKMILRNKNKFVGVIHNAAPIISEKTFEAREKVRGEFSAQERDVLIAVSGRMVYDKGISFISDAITKMELDGVKFIFIGDGDYCNILKQDHSKLINEKKVFVLGQRSNVLEILAGCDVFLFATLHENLSNALLEACTIGLPAIATNVGGNPEVITDGVNGYLIPPMDSNAIKEKLEILCSDVEIRQRFGNNSKKIMNEKFSQRKIFSQIDNIYCSYIENSEKA